MIVDESNRIKNFRLQIVKQIPKFPNNKNTIDALKSKSLGTLMIDYMNWAIRYVAPRPRKIIIEDTLFDDPRWLLMFNDVKNLLHTAESGGSLIPYLSLKPHTRGFTPASSRVGQGVDRWADKDMLLNTRGYHHFHLDAASNHDKRSNNLIFAHVTRDTFTVIGIFDHSIFKRTERNQPMTPERSRVWKIADERAARGMPSGAVLLMPPIATSGHPVQLVMLASKYARIVYDIDPKIDQKGYIQGLLGQTEVKMLAPPKIKWDMYFLDLCLIDVKNKIKFIIHKGWS